LIAKTLPLNAVIGKLRRNPSRNPDTFPK